VSSLGRAPDPCFSAGWAILRALRPAGQALIHQDGHSYDQRKATEQDGTEETFYFNIDIPMKEYR
jgi:hypothetical protein